MKTITVIGTSLLILCFAAAGISFAAEKGSGTKSDVKKEAPAGLDKSKAPAEQEKQDYIKQIQNTLDDVSKDIDKLKEKAQSATGDARAKIDSTIATLKAQQETATKKLQELRSSTGAAWGEMKTGMSKAADDLRKAYEDAAKHFK
jgi:chromosome segregation ATPase